MNILKAFAISLSVASLPAIGATSALALEDGYKDSAEASTGTIVDVAAGEENFSTLVAAVKAAGLAETLSGEGPLTVFAPVNDAFAALPAGTLDALLQPENKEALQAVLTYHVVMGEVKAGDLVKMIRDSGGTAEVVTVEGTTLSAMMKDGDVVLKDGAGQDIRVVNTNVPASNGVIHVVEGVLLPSKGEES